MEQMLKDSEVSHRQDWLYDTIVGFLKSPRWKDPIQNFMNQNCHIFTGSGENSLTHTQVHMKFQELIEGLLEGYLKEIGINDEQFVECCAQGAMKNEFMKLVIEYILAIDDFLTFRKIMEKRNIEIQVEAMKNLEKRKELDMLASGFQQFQNAQQQQQYTPQIPTAEVNTTPSVVSSVNTPTHIDSEKPIPLSMIQDVESTETMMSDFVQELFEETKKKTENSKEEENEGEEDESEESEEEKEEEVNDTDDEEETEEPLKEKKKTEEEEEETKKNIDNSISNNEESVVTSNITPEKEEEEEPKNTISLSSAPVITNINKKVNPTPPQKEKEVVAVEEEEEDIKKTSSSSLSTSPAKKRTKASDNVMMFVSLPPLEEEKEKEKKKKPSIFETFDQEPSPSQKKSKESKTKKKKKKYTIGKLPAIRGLLREKLKIKKMKKKKRKKSKKSKKKSKEDKKKKMEERRRREEMEKVFNGIKLKEDLEQL